MKPLKEKLLLAEVNQKYALECAYEYLHGIGVARDKYKATKYYRLFLQLQEDEAIALDREQEQKLRTLEKKLAKNYNKYRLTSGDTRNLYGILMSFELAAQRSIRSLDLSQFINSGNAIPYFFAAYYPLEIIGETIFSIHNAIKACAEQKKYNLESFYHQLKFALKKDDRNKRLAVSLEWAIICAVSVLLPSLSVTLFSIGFIRQCFRIEQQTREAVASIDKQQDKLRDKVNKLESKIQSIATKLKSQYQLLDLVNQADINSVHEKINQLEKEKQWLKTKRTRITKKIEQLEHNKQAIKKEAKTSKKIAITVAVTFSLMGLLPLILVNMPVILGLSMATCAIVIASVSCYSLLKTVNKAIKDKKSSLALTQPMISKKKITCPKTPKPSSQIPSHTHDSYSYKKLNTHFFSRKLFEPRPKSHTQRLRKTLSCSVA